eukprot:COSAG01_NODE_2555_length_7461_cov_2.868514_5_plen_98_part_00
MGDCHPSHRHATEVEDLLLVGRVEGEVAQCPTPVLLHHLHVAEALHRLHDRPHSPQLPDQDLPAAQNTHTHTHFTMAVDPTLTMGTASFVLCLVSAH